MKYIFKILFAVFYLFTSTVPLFFNVLFAQQKYVEGTPPSVNVLPDSNMVISFTPKQKETINKFLKYHPDVDLLISKNSDQYSKVENYNYCKSGEMQYQYSCWGDLDNDKILDVVVVFKSQKVVNAYNWHTFYLVLLKGQKDGNYSPIKIYSFDGGALDGLLFHKKENVVEFYNSGVASGTFKWSNGQFIVKKMGGD